MILSPLPFIGRVSPDKHNTSMLTDSSQYVLSLQLSHGLLSLDMTGSNEVPDGEAAAAAASGRQGSIERALSGQPSSPEPLQVGWGCREGVPAGVGLGVGVKVAGAVMRVGAGMCWRGPR